MQEAQEIFNQLTIESIEIAASIDPFQTDLPEGVEIPAVEAVGWTKGHRSCDLRPRLVDGSTGEARLIDTGAQLSATKRLPTDIKDDSVNLVAVNGSRISTYGEREIKVKIGRKEYRIKAIVCDVKQDILGIDFINKYKLSMQWDDDTQSELFLVDRKADIRAPLRIVTVPTEITRAQYLESASQSAGSQVPSNFNAVRPPQTRAATAQDMHRVLFEVACVQKLGQADNINVSNPLEIHEV